MKVDVLERRLNADIGMDDFETTKTVSGVEISREMKAEVIVTRRSYVKKASKRSTFSWPSVINHFPACYKSSKLSWCIGLELKHLSLVPRVIFIGYWHSIRLILHMLGECIELI